MKPILGRLEPVDLRQAWLGEATDFTPWLAEPENIALLSATIGIELEVESQEKDVGPFRADILCRDTTNDHYVLIENQLERTDHTHLGQLLTYAAGLDAVTIVWIAARFTDEHRAALDWLNRATGEGYDFFGLEVEVWRIGDSPLAPKFNIVSKPNEWAKIARTAAGTGGDVTDRQRWHLAYWQQFHAYLEQRQLRLLVSKPGPRHYLLIPTGRGSFRIVLFNNVRERRSGVYLQILGADAKAYFNLLKAGYQDTLDVVLRPFGEVSWRLMPEATESQVMVQRPWDQTNESTWPALNQWFADLAVAMHDSLRPMVRTLDAADWSVTEPGEPDVQAS